MTSQWLAGLLAVAAVVGCATAEGDAQGETADAVAEDTALVRVVNVETRVVEPTRFTDFIRITGEASAFSDVIVSAEEGGVVEVYEASKGDRVRGGQVLARMDADVLTAQTAEARASAALAGEQYERQRRLWEDEGIGSEIAFLQAKYQAEIASARLATLEARLDRTVIRAPMDGVFDDRFVEAGEIAMAGAPVVRVVAIDRIKITGGVPERYAAAVRRGSSAEIGFDLFPGRVFSGRIDFVGSSVDDQSRTFPIEIVMDNPDGLIKPQMVANVQLVRTALEDAVVVAQNVVRRGEAGYQVFVAVERDGRLTAQARVVTLGPAYGGQVVVESGLAPGDRLITLGSQLVDDGSRIRVVGAATSADGEGSLDD